MNLTDPTDTAAWDDAVDALERTPVPFRCDRCHLAGTVHHGEAIGRLPGIETEPAAVLVVTHDGGPAQEFACPWCHGYVLAVL